MEKKQSTQKAKNFLKKNVYYIIMAVCLLAIAAMITVAILINNGVIGNTVGDPDAGTVIKPSDEDKDPPKDNTDNKVPDVKPDDSNTNNGDDAPTLKPDDTENPIPTAIIFASPVQKINVIQGYSMDALVWNPTLKHYAVHNGIDYAGSDGDDVMAAYDGVVSAVSYDVLNGHTVTIKHSETLSTIYSSLNEPTVKVGQTVKKGDVIGTMGTTATAEYSLGAHVHFTVTENGQPVNPDAFLTQTDNK